MGKGFLDDDADSYSEFESNYKKKNKKINKRKRYGTGLTLPHITFPSGLEWYDYIMIPLLCIFAIMIILNFTSVMEFFLMLTIRVLDLGLLIIVLLIVIFIIYICFKRPRW